MSGLYIDRSRSDTGHAVRLNGPKGTWIGSVEWRGFHDWRSWCAVDLLDSGSGYSKEDAAEALCEHYLIEHR